MVNNSRKYGKFNGSRDKKERKISEAKAVMSTGPREIPQWVIDKQEARKAANQPKGTVPAVIRPGLTGRKRFKMSDGEYHLLDSVFSRATRIRIPHTVTWEQLVIAYKFLFSTERRAYHSLHKKGKNAKRYDAIVALEDLTRVFMHAGLDWSAFTEAGPVPGESVTVRDVVNGTKFVENSPRQDRNRKLGSHGELSETDGVRVGKASKKEVRDFVKERRKEKSYDRKTRVSSEDDDFLEPTRHRVERNHGRVVQVPPPPTDWKTVKVRKHFKTSSALNGAQGEVTGDDDMWDGINETFGKPESPLKEPLLSLEEMSRITGEKSPFFFTSAFGWNAATKAMVTSMEEKAEMDRQVDEVFGVVLKQSPLDVAITSLSAWEEPVVANPNTQDENLGNQVVEPVASWIEKLQAIARTTENTAVPMRDKRRGQSRKAATILPVGEVEAAVLAGKEVGVKKRKKRARPGKADGNVVFKTDKVELERDPAHEELVVATDALCGGYDPKGVGAGWTLGLPPPPDLVSDNSVVPTAPPEGLVLDTNPPVVPSVAIVNGPAVVPPPNLSVNPAPAVPVPGPVVVAQVGLGLLPFVMKLAPSVPELELVLDVINTTTVNLYIVNPSMKLVTALMVNAKDLSPAHTIFVMTFDSCFWVPGNGPTTTCGLISIIPYSQPTLLGPQLFTDCRAPIVAWDPITRRLPEEVFGCILTRAAKNPVPVGIVAGVSWCHFVVETPDLDGEFGYTNDMLWWKSGQSIDYAGVDLVVHRCHTSFVPVRNGFGLNSIRSGNNFILSGQWIGSKNVIVKTPLFRQAILANSVFYATHNQWFAWFRFLWWNISDQNRQQQASRQVQIVGVVVDQTVAKVMKNKLTGPTHLAIQSEVLTALRQLPPFLIMQTVLPELADQVRADSVSMVQARVLEANAHAHAYLDYSQKPAKLINEFFTKYGASEGVYEHKTVAGIVVAVLLSYLTYKLVQWLEGPISRLEDSTRRLENYESASIGNPVFWFLVCVIMLLIGLWSVYGYYKRKESEAVIELYRSTLSRKELFDVGTVGRYDADKLLRMNKFHDYEIPDRSKRSGLEITSAYGMSVTENGKISMLESRRGDEYYYQSCGLASSFHVPDNHGQSLSAAADKVLSTPPLSPVTQASQWSCLIHCHFPLRLTGLDVLLPMSMEEVESFINEHDPAKRKMYANALKNVLKNDGRFFTKWSPTSVSDVPHHAGKQSSLQVKHDEMLFNGKDKPRNIINTSPEAVVMFGPWVSRATKVAKNIWSGLDTNDYGYEIPVYNGIKFRAYFAPGKTFLELGAWADMVESRGDDSFDLAVAGDDTVIVLTYRGQKYYIETDYSAYDASQGLTYDKNTKLFEGPVANTLQVLQECGVPQCIALALGHQFMGSIKMEDPTRDTRATVNFKDGCFFHTGSSATTFNNSVNNIALMRFMVSILNLHNIPDGMVLAALQKTITDACRVLGFSIKIRVAETFDELTFLKGRFVVSKYTVSGSEVYGGELKSGFLWTPDMGVACKFGYHKRHPTEMYPKKDTKAASKMALSAVANGWSTFPPTPILRAFVTKFIDKSVEAEQTEFYYKPKCDVDVQVEVISQDLEAMYRWYDTTQEEVAIIEDLIKNASADNWIITHPLVLRMASKLYG